MRGREQPFPAGITADREVVSLRMLLCGDLVAFTTPDVTNQALLDHPRLVFMPGAAFPFSGSTFPNRELSIWGQNSSPKSDRLKDFLKTIENRSTRTVPFTTTHE